MYTPIQVLISPFLTIISLYFSSLTIPSHNTHHVIQRTSYFPQTNPQITPTNTHLTCVTTTTSSSANVAASNKIYQLNDAPPNATVYHNLRHNLPQSSSYVNVQPPISTKKSNGRRKLSTMMERYASFIRERKERRRKRLGRL
jgi:hypothetical protein